MADGSASGDWQSYTIDLGQHFTGDSAYLGFMNDHDVSNADAESAYRNIQLTEANNGGNQAPSAQSDSASTQPDGSVTIDVLGNDSDPDGDALSVTSVGAGTAAQHGTTVLNADGTVTYTPDAGYKGNDSFSYSISDGNGGEASAQVDVSVADGMAFQADDFSGYGKNQDKSGGVSVSDGGTTVGLQGNTWKKAALDYTVTEDTVLTFDFKVPKEGEIHGILVDQDDEWANGNELEFQLSGSQREQNSANADYNGRADADWQTYEIEIGNYVSGEFEYIGFVNDHDVANADAESAYRNIQLIGTEEFQNETVHPNAIEIF
jgi:hypothetical protein